jgi:hypothetical protein
MVFLPDGALWTTKLLNGASDVFQSLNGTIENVMDT